MQPFVPKKGDHLLFSAVHTKISGFAQAELDDGVEHRHDEP